MGIISYIKNKIEYKKTRRNSASYVKYLKDKGLRIGGVLSSVIQRVPLLI